MNWELVIIHIRRFDASVQSGFLIYLVKMQVLWKPSYWAPWSSVYTALWQAPSVNTDSVQKIKVEVKGQTSHWTSENLVKFIPKPAPITFIQTDKPIYSPGQTGTFRCHTHTHTHTHTHFILSSSHARTAFRFCHTHSNTCSSKNIQLWALVKMKAEMRGLVQFCQSSLCQRGPGPPRTGPMSSQRLKRCRISK